MASDGSPNDVTPALDTSLQCDAHVEVKVQAAIFSKKTNVISVGKAETNLKFLLSSLFSGFLEPGGALNPHSAQISATLG